MARVKKENAVGDAYYLFDCGGDAEAAMTDLALPISHVRAVFISHMHEDHVGKLSAIAKRFTVYQSTDDRLRLYLPERTGIDAFCAWLNALHLTTNLHRLEYHLIESGEIYRDENIVVRAVPTRHIAFGNIPSYAFVIEAGKKKILYTGDLASDFSDYPAVLLTEDFDLVVSELVHFNLDENIDLIKKTRTKRLVFTHMGPEKASLMKERLSEFSYPVSIANDGDVFTV